ncbi:peptidylprolyl isomerase [Actinokineospora auranticolor]|nr:peptidylprolyl isomerase [Actinokineospora auranticolor]
MKLRSGAHLVGLAALAMATVGCATTVSGLALPAPGASPAPKPTPAKATTCVFVPDGRPSPSEADEDRVGRGPQSVAEDRPYTALVATSAGEITVELDVEHAPCAARNFAFLIDNRFYNNTPCHRVTKYAQLKVLQCGDPTGTGTGGPGYTIPDELPKDLKKAGNATNPDDVVYPRGTVAMAATDEPNSAGSQFFVVYGDSVLPPDYTVFGETDAEGLAVVDKVAGGELTPELGPEDGKPTPAVTIQKITYSG